jgi:hypothetical protein
VEDIVAIKVVGQSGRKHFFLTWGRIFDSIDGKPLLAAVRPNLRQWGVYKTRSLQVCCSLQEAASEPYFYEALFMMAQERIPFGPKYKSWQSRKRKEIRKGKEIWYLGKKI